ncbi:putative sulfate/molybdate transporter [Halomonas sp. PBN3]|uniref:putative sulfate/molybdate transporter n=1 Tax=Halomonas sp. PBN3 TaxID=1397528 RepID=UPI0003B81FCC|nr:putative sulfate/molybdate transporter [Halomonas sp. PBN3]ERS91888.1 hypothetical protein Q671_14800 [Halomonas sp. PBN3]
MTSPSDKSPRRHSLVALGGDISGAFGDLGTLLPYVIAGIGLGVLAPGPVFLGFAAGYLLVALLYRAPIAVQPMKALGAVILTGGLTAAETALAGALLGLVLLALAATPLLGRAARALPQSVVTGLQAGLGLMLASLALEMMATGWWLALPAMALLALSWVWPRGPWALVVILVAVVLAPGEAQPLASATAVIGEGLSLAAVAGGVLAQLPLTLLNAVVVAAHYRFGARSVIAPLAIAAACALAALQAEAVVAWLAAIPVPVVGALLAFAGVELMLSKRLFDARPDCRPVIAVTAVATLFGSALVGLAAGLASEQLRRHLVRRRARGTPHDRG